MLCNVLERPFVLKTAFSIVPPRGGPWSELRCYRGWETTVLVLTLQWTGEPDLYKVRLGPAPPDAQL